MGGRAIKDGRWRLRKASGVVKVLALAPNHRLHRERVMEMLWPNLDAASAMNNLQHALHVARKALDATGTSPRYLSLRDEHLALCPDDPLWVDVEAFEKAAARARRAREIEVYRTALRLYAGELLPEDRYEAWAEGRRAELQRTHLELLAESAEIHEANGGLAAATDALRSIVVRDPAHEEARAGLMRLFAASGHRYQALREYEQLGEALRRELGAEPEPSTRLLYEDILSGGLPLAGSSRVGMSRPEREGEHNLPAPLTSFIGREREVSEVECILGHARLLTLIGAGGVGKTRLALEVARDLVGTYPDGVWLAELASLSEPELLHQAVATTLGVREQAGHPLTETLLGALRQKELLLVLDNCEHLIEDVARLADALLGGCPRLRILATSREPLGVAGEVEWVVKPLATPGEGNPADAESARLFVDRARRRQPGFELTEENSQAVGEICRRLDGVPLAVELAAARVGVLAPEQISARLDDALVFLTEGNRTASPRHRTLRATLAWSHNLLDERERLLFERLSVFSGGFSLEAAEAVGAEGGIGDKEVLDLLSKLVHKSLVVVEAEGGALRYGLLEPVRQYARERLEEDGGAEVAHRQHAAFFLALAEEARPGINSVDRDVCRARLEAERGNLRTALRWSLENGEVSTALRMANAVFWFWFHRGHWKEGRGWLEEALAMGGAEPERAEALGEVGMFAWLHGDHEVSRSCLEESVEMCRKSGHGRGLIHPLHFLSMEMLGRGETASARSLVKPRGSGFCSLRSSSFR